MPYINLIQEERLATKQLERKQSLFQATFVGGLVLTMGAVGFFMLRAAGLSDEEEALKDQARKAQPLVTKMNENKALLAEFQPRLNTLEDAQSTTGKWGSILEYLTVQTPPQTWLTTLRASVADPTKPVSLAFAGLSDKQELVGEYILRLQGCSDLENVQLRFTAEKPVSMARAIEFEINAEIPGTATQKVVKEEGKGE